MGRYRTLNKKPTQLNFLSKVGGPQSAIMTSFLYAQCIAASEMLHGLEASRSVASFA